MHGAGRLAHGALDLDVARVRRPEQRAVPVDVLRFELRARMYANRDEAREGRITHLASLLDLGGIESFVVVFRREPLLLCAQLLAARLERLGFVEDPHRVLEGGLPRRVTASDDGYLTVTTRPRLQLSRRIVDARALERLQALDRQFTILHAHREKH